MTKSIYILIFSFSLTLLACNDDQPLTSNTIESSARTSSLITLDIVQTDNAVISVTVESFTAAYVGSDSISLVVNPGQVNSATYMASSFDAYQSDDAMDIINNDGDDQTTYSEKNHVKVSTNSSQQLSLFIENGSISTNADTMIGEETEGI